MVGYACKFRLFHREESDAGLRGNGAPCTAVDQNASRYRVIPRLNPNRRPRTARPARTAQQDPSVSSRDRKKRAESAEAAEKKALPIRTEYSGDLVHGDWHQTTETIRTRSSGSTMRRAYTALAGER